MTLEKRLEPKLGSKTPPRQFEDAPKRSRDSSKTAPNGSKLVAKLVAESWRRVLVPGMW